MNLIFSAMPLLDVAPAPFIIYYGLYALILLIGAAAVVAAAIILMARAVKKKKKAKPDYNQQKGETP